MEQSEIIEGNKLIDRFMGVKRRDEFSEHNNGFSYIQSIKYHSSWDWLMPVVEKIDETCPQHPEFEDADTGYACTLFSATDSPWKIENTYETVIKYIKWYNTQNQ